MSTVRSIEEMRNSDNAGADNSPKKLSFKERQLIAREDAIIAAVNNLLANKGYELMTMDEVAAEVGIAKASLYKHFVSKESLAAAAMVRLLEATTEFVNSLEESRKPLEKIRDVLGWALSRRLKGNLPLLPATNSTLRDTLVSDMAYMAALNNMSDKIGSWIEAAQAAGQMPKDVPAIALLYSVYSRTCDPAVDYLKLSGEYSDEEIVEWMLTIALNGLNSSSANSSNTTVSKVARV
jgi:TetR/AcrR family transcriptional regulator, regulator of autoinduction and epiphytic fitness